jgi:hypothetical protein
MGKITVLAGDFLKGDGQFNTHSLTGLPASLHLRTKEDPFMGENFYLSEIETVELASEESVKKLGGTIGWGAVGGLLLGPVGLLAGLLAGGRGKEVVFVAKFKKGQKLLASTDSKTFTQLQAALFK